MNEDLLKEVLVQTRKAYNHINEIFRITKELGDALSRNDKGSSQLLLGMRQDEMSLADGCRKNIILLVESADGQERELLEGWLFGNGNTDQGNGGRELLTDQGRIFLDQIQDMNKMTAAKLKETVAVDKAVSVKLAGDDSFYKK